MSDDQPTYVLDEPVTDPEAEDAVQRGTGNADATKRTSPLTGESPAENREENGEDYGD
jgi:hypothetical protein